MLIPINTDAPLYHFPWGTIGLIVANVLCFVATGCATDDARLVPWTLQYGNGLNPVGWLSSIFAHGGWMHLIGNMFFLWGFGLVVEGKLGLWRFLKLYLIMGLLQSACVDLLTLHRSDEYVLRQLQQTNGWDSPDDLRNEFENEFLEDLPNPPTPEDEAEARQYADSMTALVVDALRGRRLGASGVIFGLMAISLVWAPKNEMQVILFFGFRVFSFDLAIMYYALLYLAMNVVGLLFEKFAMGTSGLHMVGAVVGFATGVLYLRRDWVDCERWDLFSVLSGKYGRFADENWSLGAHAHTDKVYSEIPVPGKPSANSEAAAGSSLDSEPESSGQDPTAVRKTRVSKSLLPVTTQIDAGDYIGASETLFNLRLVDSKSQLDQERLRTLAIGLVQADAPDEAEIYLDEYIDRFPEDRGWAVTRMAQLLLSDRSRPAAALSLLKSLKKSELDPRQLASAKKIAAECQTQIREGIQDAEQEW